MLAYVATPVAAPELAFNSKPQIAHVAPLPSTSLAAAQLTALKPYAKSPAIPDVPFFSQLKDIQSPQWQQVGCGITSLAMMIDFYKPNTVSVNGLLQQGIIAGAYDDKAGWNLGGLIQLGERYGLAGIFYDFSALSAKTALSNFKTLLSGGPLILAVHNKFNPKSTVPHLVVIDGIKNNVVYYNDPAAKSGKKRISVSNLIRGWKKKMIVLRPADKSVGPIGMIDLGSVGSAL